MGLRASHFACPRRDLEAFIPSATYTHHWISGHLPLLIGQNIAASYIYQKLS